MSAAYISRWRAISRSVNRSSVAHEQVLDRAEVVMDKAVVDARLLGQAPGGDARVTGVDEQRARPRRGGPPLPPSAPSSWPSMTSAASQPRHQAVEHHAAGYSDRRPGCRAHRYRLEHGLFDRKSHDVSEYHWNLRTSSRSVRIRVEDELRIGVGLAGRVRDGQGGRLAGACRTVPIEILVGDLGWRIRGPVPG